MKLIKPLSKTSAEESTSPRSAQVRERRSSTSQARVHAAGRNATNPVTRRTVPVTPGFRAQPLMQRTSSKARRKFSISLGADGAQLVLPAIPIVRPGWQTLSAILVVAFLAAIIFMTSSDTFRVDTLTVNGAQRVQVEDIMAVLNIKGDTVYSLNPDELTLALKESFPEFSSIQLSVGLPNQVTLDVVERQPIFEWQHKEDILWIDLDGAVFRQRGVATAAVTVTANVPPPMVPAEGAPVETEEEEEAGQKLVPDFVKDAEFYDPEKFRVDMDVMMAAANLTLKKPADASLMYDMNEGFGWHDPRGWDVYFGSDLDDMDLKFSMYETIVGQLAQQGIQPVLISVAHVHAPFYRPADTGSVEQ